MLTVVKRYKDFLGEEVVLLIIFSKLSHTTDTVKERGA